jgi:hypothetical protein
VFQARARGSQSTPFRRAAFSPRPAWQWCQFDTVSKVAWQGMSQSLVSAAEPGSRQPAARWLNPLPRSPFFERFDSALARGGQSAESAFSVSRHGVVVGNPSSWRKAQSTPLAKPANYKEVRSFCPFSKTTPLRLYMHRVIIRYTWPGRSDRRFVIGCHSTKPGSARLNHLQNAILRYGPCHTPRPFPSSCTTPINPPIHRSSGREPLVFLNSVAVSHA